MKADKHNELKNKKDATQNLKVKNILKKNKLKNKKTAAKKVNKLEKNIEEAIAKELVTVVKADSAKKGIKKKKNKLNIAMQPKLQSASQEVSASEKKGSNGVLTEKDIIKIAKKKAKKLAQKLKIQQKKKEDLREIKDSKNKAKLDRKKNKIKKENKNPIPTDNDTASLENKNPIPIENDTAFLENSTPKSVNPKKQSNKNPIPTGHDTASLENTASKSVNQKKQRKVDKKKLAQKLKNDGKEEPKPKSALINFEFATVFVGNLPVNTKRIQLVRLFEKFGPISAIRFRTAGGKSILKHKQRKEAGSLNAYVVLKDETSVDMAVELNGIEFKSNHLRVTRVGKNAHKAEHVDTKNMVFVGNLKYSTTEEKLREIFSSCGEIEYVRCIREGEKGCKGVAYVCFKSSDAVGLALELNETMLDERPIHVERYSEKKLGAKEARDKNAPSQGKKNLQTGAQKRLGLKKTKHLGKSPTKVQNSTDKKKSQFRGVKVNDMKKKQKKKKPSSQLKQIAKKIAPKTN